MAEQVMSGLIEPPWMRIRRVMESPQASFRVCRQLRPQTLLRALITEGASSFCTSVGCVKVSFSARYLSCIRNGSGGDKKRMSLILFGPTGCFVYFGILI